MSDPVVIVSFGYLHDPPPKADVIVDVRRHLHDPHVSLIFRELDGTDARVIGKVLDTPGAIGLINGLLMTIRALQRVELPAGLALTIAIGCAGGRHRSVVLADYIADRLMNTGQPAVAVHRDIDKLVVTR
jgi:UPF0042 nucleotide-binding protein